MKTKFLYFFILLLTLTVSISSCSSDDDDKPKTFLEKYDGTKWTYKGKKYLRFIDDKNIIYEVWDNYVDCYSYYTFVDNINSIEFTEDSVDKLVFEALYDNIYDEEKWFTGTITVEGKILKLVSYDGNDAGREIVYYLDKTSENVDSFKICD